MTLCESVLALSQTMELQRQPQQQQRIMHSEPKFPARLHYLLGDLAKDGHADIVSWAIHGRSFKVHKPREFVELVLCRYVCEKQKGRKTG